VTDREFEELLERCCRELTSEARDTGVRTSGEFENRVREVVDSHASGLLAVKVDYSPHTQAFSDIALGEYGIEVKFN